MAVWHNVSRKTGSSFFNVYGKHLKVLSYHHQSVKRLGKGTEDHTEGIGWNGRGDKA